jgi:hypothetical protein
VHNPCCAVVVMLVRREREEDDRRRTTATTEIPLGMGRESPAHAETGLAVAGESSQWCDGRKGRCLGECQSVWEYQNDTQS